MHLLEYSRPLKQANVKLSALLSMELAHQPKQIQTETNQMLTFFQKINYVLPFG